MEQQLQEPITKVSTEHDATHDDNGGTLLELQSRQANYSQLTYTADTQDHTGDEHAKNLEDVMKNLRGVLDVATTLYRDRPSHGLGSFVESLRVCEARMVSILSNEAATGSTDLRPWSTQRT